MAETLSIRERVARRWLQVAAGVADVAGAGRAGADPRDLDPDESTGLPRAFAIVDEEAAEVDDTVESGLGLRRVTLAASIGVFVTPENLRADGGGAVEGQGNSDRLFNRYVASIKAAALADRFLTEPDNAPAGGSDPTDDEWIDNGYGWGESLAQDVRYVGTEAPLYEEGTRSFMALVLFEIDVNESESSPYTGQGVTSRSVGS